MSYQPNPINDGSIIGQYLNTELHKLADSLQNLEVDSTAFKIWNVEPDKPRQGELYYADGTNWDAGSGEGLYLYSAGQWNFIALLGASGFWASVTASINASKVTGAAQPNWSVFRDGIYAYAFSASALNEAWVCLHIPHSYKRGTDIEPSLHWAAGNTTNTGTVRLGVEYTIAKSFGVEAFPASTTIYVEQAANGTPYMHYHLDFDPADVIPADSREPDTLIMARVFRDAAHANDTFTGDAFILNFDLHVQMDRIGTLNSDSDFYT